MSPFYYTQYLRCQAEAHFIIEFAFFSVLFWLHFKGLHFKISGSTSHRGPEVELEHHLHHQHGLTKTVVPEDPKTQQAPTETADQLLLLHNTKYSDILLYYLSIYLSQ